MERILIIGDVHLGKGLNLGKSAPGHLNSRLLDQSKLLDWILEVVEEKFVTTLVFTGDIFEDVKPDYRVFEIFAAFLQRTESLNLEVHLILGNHELKRTGGQIFSPLQILTQNHDHVYYHSNINTFHKENVSLTFFPFTDRRILQATSHSAAIEKLSSSLPYELSDSPIGNKKVLIGHLAIEGAIYVGDEIDDQSTELHCPLSMFSDYDYVFMGHVHKPQIHQIEPTFVAHTGSLDLSDFGEVDHKKQIILLDFNLKDEIQFLTVPSRPLRKFLCQIDSTSEDPLYEVRKSFQNGENDFWKNSILKMEIATSVPISDELRSAIKKIPFEFGVFHIAYFIETNKQIFSEVVEQTSEGLSLLTPEIAIKKFAQTLSLSDSQKEKFISIALSSLNEISK